MPYKEYKPIPELALCIECFWHYQKNDLADKPNITIPDNCSDILFDLSQHDKISSLFVGTMTRPIFSSKKEIMGIRFKPGYAFAFFGIPMNEFTDMTVKLCEFWKNTDLFEHGIYLYDNIFQRINYLQEMLISFRQNLLSVDVRLNIALQTISKNTEFNSIENMSSELGLSRQHLRRIFLKYVGINPVEFMRISRIRKTIKQIKTQTDPEMSRIAQDFGYYDQSHMIIDFRKFTGCPPGEFFSKNR